MLFKKKIHESKISYPPGNPVDPFGKVFFKDGRVFRAISYAYKEFCEQLLKSSLVQELTEKKLIPKTILAENIYMNGYAFILEHEKVTNTYPTEWSFCMLKDAGLTILEVNKICKKYNFCLKDAHPWNIAFNKNKPLFIDFGSIVYENDSVQTSFIQEYKDTILYPLILWSKHEDLIAQALLSSPSNMYKFTAPPCKLSQSKLFTSMLNSLEQPEVSEEYVQNITLEKEDTLWTTYQNDFFHEIQKNNFCERFERYKKIQNLLQTFASDAETIIDIAGNMGAFSYFLEKTNTYTKIINTDYDENVIDMSYKKLKELESRVETYVLNFILPKRNNISDDLRSDIVLALAITHHLLLTQNFSLDLIFDRIKSFSKKYVCIEFMPLGLWGGGELPAIPEWYTEDWFRNNFIKKFHLLHTEKLEKNRIIYIGTI